jgi:hypothetical protein
VSRTGAVVLCLLFFQHWILTWPSKRFKGCVALPKGEAGRPRCWNTPDGPDDSHWGNQWPSLSAIVAARLRGRTQKARNIPRPAWRQVCCAVSEFFRLRPDASPIARIGSVACTALAGPSGAWLTRSVGTARLSTGPPSLTLTMRATPTASQSIRDGGVRMARIRSGAPLPSAISNSDAIRQTANRRRVRSRRGALSRRARADVCSYARGDHEGRGGVLALVAWSSQRAGSLVVRSCERPPACSAS